jgi:hypothetical protein
MEEFKQFIGKNYSDVNNQITDLAATHGWQAVPWPVNVGMVALDETTLIVEIESDINDIIVNIKRDI